MTVSRKSRPVKLLRWRTHRGARVFTAVYQTQKYDYLLVVRFSDETWDYKAYDLDSDKVCYEGWACETAAAAMKQLELEVEERDEE